MAGNVIEVTDATFETEVVSSDKTTLVDFWAPWCGPCVGLAPTIDTIANENPEMKVCKVNVDENPEIAAKFGIRGIPTLMVFKEGKPVNQLTGAATKESIMNMMHS